MPENPYIPTEYKATVEASLVIEQDALTNTDYQDPPPTPHTHEVSSFVATPRHDPTLFQRMRSLVVSDNQPGSFVVDKSADGLRTMFVITSNSYEDREFETITSQALKDYEASCFPGEGLFYCDNPYVFWHDDDIPMGEIISVNYSEPFLVEIVKELDNPVAKLLWDFAEENGDNAGASHRFGYREGDKASDGTYSRIYKQETSYLPSRNLAANIGTYSGVMTDMATKQSDEWFDKVVLERTGGAIRDAAKKMHERTGALAEELKGLGINHKAVKPPIPPLEADVVTDVAAETAEGVIEEDTKGEMSMPVYAEGLNRILSLIMDMVDAQLGLQDSQAAMAKEFKEFGAARITEKTYTQSLEDQIKALKTRVEIAEKRLDLQPRSVAVQQPLDAKAIVNAVQAAEKSRVDGDLVDDPIFGKLKPAPIYGT